MTAVTAGTSLHTDHLAPTSLAELNATAGLLTRVDRKYLVGLDDAQAVLDQLARRARVLEIDTTRAFTYTTISFDTPDLAAYHATARRRHRRFKVRTRTYVDSGLCFLEVKTRGARGTTVKQRVSYPADDASHLSRIGRDFVSTCLAEAGICSPAGAHTLAARLSPVLRTTYRRTTLHLPDDAARATLDTHLTWTALGDDTALDHGTGEAAGTAPTASCRARPAAAVPDPHHLEVGGLAIVETKNPATPSPTDRLLWARGRRPIRLSKYATGMALLHPGLPSNAWHRVMRQLLATALAA